VHIIALFAKLTSVFCFNQTKVQIAAHFAEQMSNRAGLFGKKNGKAESVFDLRACRHAR
jgi:hypothetical protein